MSEEPLRVGLLGRGTVGGAFAELLESRADEVAALSGRRPEISGVLTRSQGSFEEILAGSDVIVEVMGGLDPARDHVVAALEAGVPVITANKQLVSRCGPELWEAAAQGGSQLRFEASVAAVVPVVRTLTESLAGADIDRVHGIVNGTTNFILSEMAATGAGYAEALAEAQRLGYAEADPSDDVGGGDAAAKMAILAQLAFDGWVDIDDVVFEGIEELTAEDLAYAREFDLALKLLGTAERVGDQVSVRVNPAFLYSEHPLASVNGSFNAVTIEGADITEVTLSGPGAGGPQTASAILGDLVSIVTGVPAIGAPAKSLSAAAEVVSSFYLHLEVADRPGVLAQIAGVLGEHGVSVKSVVQKGVGEGARLAMVTHPIGEKDFMAARDAIAGLDFVGAPPRVIRVIDEHFEG
ncbi:MAG: homoserine dehydrogenase [Solirubrobacterales bacterium]